jgi:hypothetical protein
MLTAKMAVRHGRQLLDAAGWSKLESGWGEHPPLAEFPGGTGCSYASCTSQIAVKAKLQEEAHGKAQYQRQDP